MSIRLILISFAAFLCVQILAQNPDSLYVTGGDSLLGTALVQTRADTVPKETATISDTLAPKEKKTGVLRRMFAKNYPNPRTAALLSFVLPGAGQAYNKKWWKIPLAWGALGGIAYFTFDTQKTYHELRDNYKILVDDDPNTNPSVSPYNTFDATRTKTYRDTYRSYTEKWYLALGVTYLLTVTDAFVDAHLARFDVSDDLSLRLKPSLENAGGLPAFGIGVSFALGNHQTRPNPPFATPILPRP